MQGQLHLSPDTQATLLLYGSLGETRDSLIKPLTLKEYNRLARWLMEHNRRPADLLGQESTELLNKFQDQTVTTQRVTELLQRGMLLALSAERWGQMNIWVLGRSDNYYPPYFRRHFRSAAPPILYGAGNPTVMSRGGVCIVGSRDATEDGLAFARLLGSRCAKDALTVISGAARGIDREAMNAAIAAGGTVVGVLADSLEKTMLSKNSREAICSERLVLVSPFAPNAHFSVANAMDRNKYLYCLADFAVIADSAQKGGTWTGALENRNNRWVPAFVRSEPNIGLGNQALIRSGLIPLCSSDLDNANSLVELFKNIIDLKKRSTVVADDTESLATPDKSANHTEAHLLPGLSSEDDGKLQQHLSEARERPEYLSSAQSDSTQSVHPLGDYPKTPEARQLYTAFISMLITYLKERPQSESAIMKQFGLERSQTKKWLDAAFIDKSIEKYSNPVRYGLIEQPPQLTLDPPGFQVVPSPSSDGQASP